MSLSMRIIPFVILTLLSVGTASSEQPLQMAQIALVEKPWALAIDITGYRVQVDGLKPDGRRYFFAANPSTSMNVSVTLEAVPGQATEQGCLAHLERIARGSQGGVAAHLSTVASSNSG